MRVTHIAILWVAVALYGSHLWALDLLIEDRDQMYNEVIDWSDNWSNAVSSALGALGGMDYDVFARITEVCQKYNIGSNEVRQVMNECLQAKLNDASQNPTTVARAMSLAKAYGDAETVQLLKGVLEQNPDSEIALSNYLQCLNNSDLSAFITSHMLVPSGVYGFRMRYMALITLERIYQNADSERKTIIRELIDRYLAYEPKPYLFYRADCFMLENDPTYTNSVKRTEILRARNITVPPPFDRAIWPLDAIVPSYPPPAITNTP